MCSTCGRPILRHEALRRERLESKDFKHEVERVNQFKQKSRDDAHFKQLIFNRASKCGPEKRARFIETLRDMGRDDLAGFVEMTFKLRGE